MVGTMKDMRSQLVGSNAIAAGWLHLLYPYHIEGMLCSVPNDKFGLIYTEIFANSINRLLATDRAQINMRQTGVEMAG
jgi:hypothetical protein